MDHELTFSDPGAAGVIQDLRTILSLIQQIRTAGGGIGIGGGVGGRGGSAGRNEGIGGTINDLFGGVMGATIIQKRSIQYGTLGRTHASTYLTGLLASEATRLNRTQGNTYFMTNAAQRGRTAINMTFGPQTTMKKNFDAGTGGGSGLGRRGMPDIWSGPFPGDRRGFITTDFFNLYAWGSGIRRLGKMAGTSMLKQAFPSAGRGLMRAATGKMGPVAAILIAAKVAADLDRGDDPDNDSAIRFTTQRWRQLWNTPKNALERRNFAIHESAKEYEGRGAWVITTHKSKLLWNWTIDDPVERSMVSDINKGLQSFESYWRTPGLAEDVGKKAYQIGAMTGRWDEYVNQRAALAATGRNYISPYYKTIYARVTPGG